MENQLQIDLRLENEAELEEHMSQFVEKIIENNIPSELTIKNKHEAYGVVAEHFSLVTNKAKGIKTDMGTLLSFLSFENNESNVVNTISNIYSTALSTAKEAIVLSAFCQKIMKDFYDKIGDDSTPLEELIENGVEFGEAETVTDTTEEEE